MTPGTGDIQTVSVASELHLEERVEGLGVRVRDLGFRVKDFRFKV